jgi:hypothetical protein
METRFLDRHAILPPPPSPSRALLAFVSALGARLAWALRCWARRGWERFGPRHVPVQAAAAPATRSTEMMPRVDLPPAWEPKSIASGIPTRHSGIRRRAA